MARKHGCMDYGPLESEGTFWTRIMDSFSNDFGYREGMRRELMEEVAVQEVKESAVAMINDDSTEVGYVRFGVVHIMHVTNETVVGRRSGILAPELVPILEAAKSVSGYESWSRLCQETSGTAFGGNPDLFFTSERQGQCSSKHCPEWDLKSPFEVTLEPPAGAVRLLCSWRYHASGKLYELLERVFLLWDTPCQVTVIHGMFVTEVTGNKNVMSRMLREVRRLNCLSVAGKRPQLALDTQLSK